MITSDRNRLVLGAVVVIGVFVYARMNAQDEEPERLFEYADERIVESSGLAASRVHDGIVYTHNDSDDRARVFAVDQRGETVAVITVRDAEARDWEAIAVGTDDKGDPAIFIADIGDNLGGAWPEVSVYRVPEPEELVDTTVEATRFRFSYADGARDAEALLVDPRDNRIHIASKEEGGGGLYRAPEELSTTDINELERIAEVPAVITDGAFAPDGQEFVLRDYFAAHLYEAPGRKVRSMLLPLTAPGESITYTSDGDALLVGSEGRGSTVWRFPLGDTGGDRGEDRPATDDEAESSPGPEQGADADGSDDASPSDRRSLTVWGNAVALAVAAVAFFGLLKVLRRRRGRPR